MKPVEKGGGRSFGNGMPPRFVRKWRISRARTTNALKIVSKVKEGAVLAPRHHYQVVTRIVAKSGAPLVRGWWKLLTQKEERLWQT